MYRIYNNYIMNFGALNEENNVNNVDSTFIHQLFCSQC